MNKTKPTEPIEMRKIANDRLMIGLNLVTGRRWRPRVRRRLTGDKNLRPTNQRACWGGRDHMAPDDRRDNAGSTWLGTSRIVDPASRRGLTTADAAWRPFLRESYKAQWRRKMFEGMTVAKLRAECRKRKVEFKDADRKPQLVSRLCGRYGA